MGISFIFDTFKLALPKLAAASKGMDRDLLPLTLAWGMWQLACPLTSRAVCAALLESNFLLGARLCLQIVVRHPRL